MTRFIRCESSPSFFFPWSWCAPLATELRQIRSPRGRMNGPGKVPDEHQEGSLPPHTHHHHHYLRGHLAQGQHGLSALSRLQWSCRGVRTRRKRRSVSSQRATTPCFGSPSRWHWRGAPPQRATSGGARVPILDGSGTPVPDMSRESFGAVSNFHASGAQPPSRPISFSQP